MMRQNRDRSHPDDRPHNREVEDEMIKKPRQEGEPPRPATEPAKPGSKGGG
ncbi:hypothetical protein [Sphingomonas crocodyli]|uniref:hypothetical protein n=1 Tax=Sphingomonas crocodyli TaxID=1979270 RepID=UPI0013E3B488|nr:hypothetical protein [Sphingomonas crocodyli]